MPREKRDGIERLDELWGFLDQRNISAKNIARLKTVLAGVVDRMRVTGVPGLFTRQMVPPGVAGNACPADDAAYQVDPTKTTNKWVKVGDDGCIHVVDAGTHAWTATTHCGLDAYKGW